MTSMKEITDGSEVWLAGQQPRLLGGRCDSCGAVFFPRPDGCAKCAGDVLVDHPLNAEGVLWTFTVQRVQPKAPYLTGDQPFEPFALGYVDLDDVMVEARLLADDLDELTIGASMRTVAVPLGRDETGTERSTFGFAEVRSIR